MTLKGIKDARATLILECRVQKGGQLHARDLLDNSELKGAIRGLLDDNVIMFAAALIPCNSDMINAQLKSLESMMANMQAVLLKRLGGLEDRVKVLEGSRTPVKPNRTYSEATTSARGNSEFKFHHPPPVSRCDIQTQPPHSPPHKHKREECWDF